MQKKYVFKLKLSELPLGSCINQKKRNKPVISSREQVIGIFKNTEDLLLGISELHSDNEIRFTNETINSQVIQTLKLLIKKYYKKADKNGNFSIILVILAHTSTPTFPKIGYISINQLLDLNNVKQAI